MKSPNKVLEEIRVALHSPENENDYYESQGYFCGFKDSIKMLPERSDSVRGRKFYQMGFADGIAYCHEWAFRNQENDPLIDDEGEI